jgi:diacylglycerol O-acyltransferase
MDRLSPLDSLFLHVEDADPHTTMAIASIAVFEPPAPTYSEFVDAVRGRLPSVPKYRQRIREVCFDLGPPVWVDDTGFDIEWHIRQTALPPPGDDEQLCRLMARVMAQRMDRDRPLWEYWLIDGLAGGHWALISKLHHSMVDGVSGTDLYRAVFDSTPQPRPPEPDDWRPRPQPSGVRLAADALGTLAATPVRESRAVLAALREPATTARRLGTFGRGLLRYATALVPAGSSSMSGPISSQRRFDFVTVARADLDRVRRAFEPSGGSGGDYRLTLNDVALGLITNGFRRTLLARGETPRPNLLRSLVPVSVRAPGEEGIYENRVSSMLAELPVHLADPVDQLAAVHALLIELKDSQEAESGQMLTALAGHDPFPAFAWPARMIFAHPQRMVTTVTTNVPGPRTPLYALGRRAMVIIPYVPIANPARIGVSIMSYLDLITFGLTGDYDTTADLGLLRGGIRSALDELLKRAETRPGGAG